MDFEVLKLNFMPVILSRLSILINYTLRNLDNTKILGYKLSNLHV